MEKCIFCFEEKELTTEHIIPEFLGGRLTIKAVCKDCNSKMGMDFEGINTNNILFFIPIYLNEIKGKSKSKHAPFKSTYDSKDGDKYRLDHDLNPYLIPNIKQKDLPDGSRKISIKIDSSDEHLLEEIIRKKIIRYFEEFEPSKNKVEIEKIISESLSQIPHKMKYKSCRPELLVSNAVDLASLRLLYLKIAYEIMYFHHGPNYLEDKVAQRIANAINKRESQLMIKGQLPLINDDLQQIINKDDCHIIFLIENTCYIRIFNTSGVVEVTDKNGDFYLTKDTGIIYFFNYKNGSIEKLNFADYLSNKY